MLNVLNTIKDFFLSVWDVLKSIIDFVVDFVLDIVYVVKLTAEFVAKIPDYIGFLPSAAVTMLILIFAVVVIYKIIGREG